MNWSLLNEFPSIVCAARPKQGLRPSVASNLPSLLIELECNRVSLCLAACVMIRSRSWRINLVTFNFVISVTNLLQEFNNTKVGRKSLKARDFDFFCLSDWLYAPTDPCNHSPTFIRTYSNSYTTLMTHTQHTIKQKHLWAERVTTRTKGRPTLCTDELLTLARPELNTLKLKHNSFLTTDIPFDSSHSGTNESDVEKG